MGIETFQESGQKKILVGRKEAPGMFGEKALQLVEVWLPEAEPNLPLSSVPPSQRDSVLGAGKIITQIY